MSIINNNKTDPNKILPMKYKWAWEHYLTSLKNSWFPTEINMIEDIELWKSNNLTEDERKIILYNLGFFSTAESLTANNIILVIYNHITNPEARCYLIRQAYEEVIHTHTFVYCCESLGLDPEYIYNMYINVPSIKAKNEFMVGLTKTLFNTDFKTDTCENIQKFVRDLIGYYVLIEGIFFYSGFAMMAAFKRKNKMKGIGEQFNFITIDESMHLSFGAHLIQQIIEENPEIWDKEFQKEIIKLFQQTVYLEKQYAYDACPKGCVGFTANQFAEYVEYIADKRLERLGLKKMYNTKNPFPWISEMMDLSKEVNFFEGKVTDYQVGGLEW